MLLWKLPRGLKKSADWASRSSPRFQVSSCKYKYTKPNEETNEKTQDAWQQQHKKCLSLLKKIIKLWVNAQKALHLPLCFLLPPLACCRDQILLADGFRLQSHPISLFGLTWAKAMKVSKKTAVGLHFSPFLKVGCIRSLGEMSTNLVGGWTNPSEKYARQIGNLPQVGMKIKNVWNHLRIVATDHFHGLPPVSAEISHSQNFPRQVAGSLSQTSKAESFCKPEIFRSFWPLLRSSRRGWRSVVQIHTGWKSEDLPNRETP